MRNICCMSLCVSLMLLVGCQTPSRTTRVEKVQPKLREEYETFGGARIAPKQLLVKISRCEGTDSKRLTESIATSAAEITHDDSTTARRVNNRCWFLITSSTLTAQRLLEPLNGAIASNRTLSSDQLSFAFVDAEPNFLIKLKPPTGDRPPAALRSGTPLASGTPDDPYFQTNQLWGLKDVNAQGAWSSSTGSPNIVVGVMDTGIYYDHPDLATNMWSAPNDYDVTIAGEVIHCPKGSHGFNAVPLTEADICDPLDQTYNSGHGTHVSGIIGAVGNNAEGVTGVNWRTKLIGLKIIDWFDNAEITGVINAIEFAIQVQQKFGSEANIRVLNASFGFFADGVKESDLTALREEIELAGTKNMLFVASAGNDGGNDNDVKPHYPSNFYDLTNLLSVTAIDGSGAIADGGGGFANHGKHSVHLGAPGREIYSTYPVTLGDSYYLKHGTSMATPFVSGAAALILSVPACSALSAADLKNLILNGVEPTPSLSETVTGGRLNISKSISLCGP